MSDTTGDVLQVVHSQVVRYMHTRSQDPTFGVEGLDLLSLRAKSRPEMMKLCESVVHIMVESHKRDLFIKVILEMKGDP